MKNPNLNYLYLHHSDVVDEVIPGDDALQTIRAVDRESTPSRVKKLRFKIKVCQRVVANQAGLKNTGLIR